MSRLSRFLHLERERAGRPDDADPTPGTAERIEGVEQPGAAPAPPRSSGADLERFGPEPPPPVEVVERAADVQPFTRCMRCRMDHAVFATRCANCGAALDTPAQRAFNEQLWAARQAEAAREAKASAERRLEQERTEGELAAARRAMGEALAREVGERERLRLGMEGEAWGGASSGSIGTPIGLRLLRALPDWRWQLGALLAVLGVLGGLTAVGISGHPLALLAAIATGILLVVPGWRIDEL